MRWCWIDRIVELTPRERLVAIKHVGLGMEPLFEHFPADEALGLPAQPIMPASLIIEGMAQTAGVLVGHAGDFNEKVILAKVSRAEVSREATPGCTLRYTATIERLDEVGAATVGVVELADPGPCAMGEDSRTDGGEGVPPVRSHAAEFVEIGRIDLMFSHIDRNLAGTQFPEHNFVFSESFRTLLRQSGVDVSF